MDNKSDAEWFEGIDAVITEPLKFKAKLAIGEDAYTSLRLKNAAAEAWGTLSMAGTAATAASSSVVATSFFAPSGMLAAIGVGTAATPIGWVIAAGVITGGAWFGITQYVKEASVSRVTVIPDFINTPMDVLALGLFDFLAPLAMKAAIIDGHIDKSEKEVIMDNFVKEWGYDQSFVEKGIAYTESKLPEFSVKELAKNLAEYKKNNPDCNYESMSHEILTFLRSVIEADGIIDEREEMAIEKVEAIFKEVNRINIMGNVQTSWNRITRTIANIVEKGIIPSKK